MTLMQCWLPALRSGVAVLRALPIALIALSFAPIASGFESSLTVLPSRPGSTLDDHVTPQNLDLQKTVIDFVDSGILTGKPKLNFQPPKSGKDSSEPKSADKPPVLPLSKANTNESAKATKLSPFQKWVKPESKIAEEPAVKQQPEQLARRMRRSASSRAPKPLPRPASKKSTAVASDKSAPKTQSTNTRPPKLTVPATPAVDSPTEYPTPQADQAPKAQVVDLPPLTNSQKNLRKKIRSVLTHYYNRPLNTRDRSPWEIMHAMLAFEADSKVLQGGPRGEPITAVGWLCYNQACKRRSLMYVNDDDELRVRVGPALQGHRGQLLAMLAQCRINENYPMLVEGHELTIKDLIEMEKRTCYPRTELTFKLIGLMHYLDSDATWLNDQGMQWDIPRLIAEEIRQPVRGAACGGTHRLGGLTLAYKTREKRGEPVDGQYLRAKKFVTRYQQYAYRLQNRDGSFSTEWFRGPGNEESLDRKLKTTGHILEWLLYAASEKELKHWRTTKAANYLATIMYRNRYKDWESGPLGHAIHALLVYDRLVFGPYDPPQQSTVASQRGATPRSARNR